VRRLVDFPNLRMITLKGFEFTTIDEKFEGKLQHTISTLKYIEDLHIQVSVKTAKYSLNLSNDIVKAF